MAYVLNIESAAKESHVELRLTFGEDGTYSSSTVITITASHAEGLALQLMQEAAKARVDRGGLDHLPVNPGAMALGIATLQYESSIEANVEEFICWKIRPSVWADLCKYINQEPKKLEYKNIPVYLTETLPHPGIALETR